MVALIQTKLNQLRKSKDISELVFRQAHSIFVSSQCQLLTQSKTKFEFTVNDEFHDYDVTILLDDDDIFAETNKKGPEWNALAVAFTAEAEKTVILSFARHLLSFALRASLSKQGPNDGVGQMTARSAK